MKKYLVAGVIILVPVLLTIMLFIFLFDLFTSPFLPFIMSLLKKFSLVIPFLQNPTILNFIARIIVLIILCIFIMILGVIARLFIFNTLLDITNRILSKIPIVKTVYKLFKDITTSFAAHERKAFTKTTMINFPSIDSYAVGFETGDVPEECQNKVSQKLKPVFIPASPHPISSFLVLVPENELHAIDMKNEDAVKFFVSCGLILPGENLEDVLKK